MDTIDIKLTKENLTKLNTSNKSKKETLQSNKDLPMVTDVLDQLVKFGTVLTYPEGEIDFRDYRQCPIKTLAVNVCSTETEDLAVLHQLYTQVRSVS